MMNTFSRSHTPPVYRPIISMVAVLALGIGMGVWLPGFLVAALAGTGIAALCVAWLTATHRSACIRPLMLVAFAGYLSIQPWMRDDLPDHHIRQYVDRGFWKIQGVVADTPRMAHGRWQFELHAKLLTDKRDRYPVFGRVRVTGRGPWPGAVRGDHVAFRGRLRSVRGFSNPGGFDYERFLKLKGIRARVYVSAGSLKVESSTRIGNWRGGFDDLRTKLSNQMDVVLSEREADSVRLLKALVLGERHQITPALREQFNRAGVGHVLAISGLHVGMVAATAFAIARCLLVWIPFLVNRGWVRKGAALTCLVPVMGYGILAGLSPSTQRAMIMVAAVMLSLWVGRRHNWLNTLAVAALVILVIFPPALLSISFQLSFSAVLAIIAGSHLFPGATERKASAIGQRLLHRMLSFLWVSAMAIMGTLPLVLHYFNQISLVGLAANVWVVPLTGLVVVPFGLLGAVGAVVSPALAASGWHIAVLGADLIQYAVQLVSAWPWAAVKTVTPNGFEVGLYYLLCAALLFWRKLPCRRAVVGGLLAVVIMDAGYWTYQRFGRSDLRVTVLDVGQASANLLELPGGFTILVDGGGFSDNQIFDVGARVVAPLLWRKKIKTVDLVVLSHANSDHLNGLLYVLAHFNVGEVWSNQDPAKTRAYRQWTRLLSDFHIRHEAFGSIPRRLTRHGVSLEILAPPADFMDRKANEPWRDLNNNSLVLRVSHGRVSILFPGDIMHAAEADMLARLGRDALRCTILIVPHHGSRSSSTPAFLAAVQPEEALISAGWRNRFGFPHGDVLERLESSGSRIWSTAESGAVEITSGGKGYAIRANRLR